MNCLGKKAKKIFRKAALAAMILGSVLLFAGAPAAQAHDSDDYYYPARQVQYTNWRLHEAIAHFGYYSPQANYWRHERREAIERARFGRHEYYEHHHRRDHDRDRDRDWDRR
jgi:hypothetical protein